MDDEFEVGDLVMHGEARGSVGTIMKLTEVGVGHSRLLGRPRALVVWSGCVVSIFSSTWEHSLYELMHYKKEEDDDDK